MGHGDCDRFPSLTAGAAPLRQRESDGERRPLPHPNLLRLLAGGRHHHRGSALRGICGIQDMATRALRCGSALPFARDQGVVGAVGRAGDGHERSTRHIRIAAKHDRKRIIGTYFGGQTRSKL